MDAETTYEQIKMICFAKCLTVRRVPVLCSFLFGLLQLQLDPAFCFCVFLTKHDSYPVNVVIKSMPVQQPKHKCEYSE